DGHGCAGAQASAEWYLRAHLDGDMVVTEHHPGDTNGEVVGVMLDVGAFALDPQRQRVARRDLDLDVAVEGQRDCVEARPQVRGRSGSARLHASHAIRGGVIHRKGNVTFLTNERSHFAEGSPKEVTFM